MKGKLAGIAFCITVMVSGISAFAADNTPNIVEWPPWLEVVHAPTSV